MVKTKVAHLVSTSRTPVGVEGEKQEAEPSLHPLPTRRCTPASAAAAAAAVAPFPGMGWLGVGVWAAPAGPCCWWGPGMRLATSASQGCLSTCRGGV